MPDKGFAVQQAELARRITGMSELIGELKEIYQLREQVRRATVGTRKPLRNRRKKSRKQLGST
jgi:hypothetical protein